MLNRSRAAVLAAMSVMASLSPAIAEDFKPLFNGTDLTGWEGDPAIWSVKDGAITGTTTAENPLMNNTFLVWKGGDVGDFELKLKYRIVNGNSGIQYRSKLIDPAKFIVGGYQADFEAGATYSGILYEERGRGILAERGQKVTINEDGTKKAEQVAVSADIQAKIKAEDWNDYTVIAQGNHLVHIINGMTTAEVTDNQADKRAMTGILALQAHQGPPMVVQFKEIQFKKLDAVKPQAAAEPTATPVEQIKVPEGFKVELVYNVPKGQQGSWVSLCSDPKGRLIASDQSGSLFRITPVGINGATEVKVEPIKAEIGQAQGLLHAFGNLYVVVNGNAAQGSGLYRVRDTDGDDIYDAVELLRKIEGGSEHGPHAVVLGPDGQSLYVVAGNFTKIPDPETSRVPRNWGEDQLLPRMPDGGGHDPNVMAPAGWVAKTDPDGKAWELIGMGMRNTYDIAFNKRGDLFAYDSDMEWDIGAPWYRPTRVMHVLSGADYGWRNGSGKWPVYYPDSTPAVVDIGPGSPTGVVFGYGAKFPPKYQSALFICDWSFGKMYAVQLSPDGASYTGQAEQFMAASPLPLTDVVVNPADGAMYFTIGGRGVQSGLYRVTFTGDPRGVVSVSKGDEKAVKTRKELEAFHGKQDPDAVKKAWKHLDHKDRFVRNAARIALEWQPVEQWKAQALEERDPQALLTALLALTRQGQSSDCGAVLDALDSLEYDKLNPRLRLEALRILGLAMIRFGQPDGETASKIVERLDPHYPAKAVEENYELSRLMAYLEAPQAVAKTVKLLTDAPTQEEQIHYAMVLRGVKSGWTPELRKTYFEWFGRGLGYRGGHSLDKFIINMRAEAVANLTAEDKAALGTLLESPAVSGAAAVPPRDVVRDWTLDEVAGLEKNLKGRNFENGRKLFSAAQCASCHRFNGEGGSVGPDLSAVGGRFSLRDLGESILDPNKVVSDQYRNTIFTLTDGRQVTGRIANLNGDVLMVVTDQLAPGNFTNIKRDQIAATFESPISPMMAGLLNTLDEEEASDLLAYLLSGGDRGHKFFK